jgi:hypothetical protein
MYLYLLSFDFIFYLSKKKILFSNHMMVTGAGGILQNQMGWIPHLF